MTEVFKIILIVTFVLFIGMIALASWSGIGVNSFKDPVLLTDTVDDCPRGRRDKYGNCPPRRIRSYYGRVYSSGTGK